MSSADDTSLLAKVGAYAVVFLSFNLIGYALSEDPPDAKRAAEQMGYSDVLLGTGRVFATWQGCGDSEWIGYEMKATAPNGQPSEGLLVCCGVFGGCTVRSDDP